MQRMQQTLRLTLVASTVAKPAKCDMLFNFYIALSGCMPWFRWVVGDNKTIAQLPLLLPPSHTKRQPAPCDVKRKMVAQHRTSSRKAVPERSNMLDLPGLDDILFQHIKAPKVRGKKTEIFIWRVKLAFSHTEIKSVQANHCSDFNHSHPVEHSAYIIYNAGKQFVFYGRHINISSHLGT